MSHNRTLESTAREIPSYANPDPRAVAVVGMSISAPGGLGHGIDTEEFYRFLQNRGSGIITVPSDRWNADAFHGTGLGKICTTKGGFIPDIRYSDPQEFSITPVEAQQMLSTHMLLIHQAFNALQRSGIDHRATNTGVYVGSGWSSIRWDHSSSVAAYYITGTTNSIAANRINYVFDLLGPSMPVDTACSSSLVAMHLAIQAIRNGDCDQAVVAGVNAQLGVLSPDGVSRSFDEDANGYARAEVASAVVIKRHDLAVKDRNRIQATLVGTALTSCGSIMGSLTTPSPEAQEAAIRLAYRDADFIELHGTGTVVGDSTEVNRAGAVFSEGRNGREVLIGSVKSNVGHGELGAYMTSLVKVVMMLENKQVLPNGYFKKPSSRIDFERFHLRVPVAVEDFIPGDPTLGRIASISSYGFGGAGGHTVLREHEPRPTLPDNITLREPLYLFAVGGLSLKGCSNLTVAPLALTFGIAESIQAATFPEPVVIPKRPSPLVLCFSGQGPQHWQQGRELYYTFKVFRDSIDECDRVHAEHTGESFLQTTGLFKPDAPKDSPLATSLMWPSDITSIALTFFQIALFDLLMSLGLKPDAVVGHSVGETAVLYASGAVPRSMAVKLATARGKALAMVDDTGGGMVVVSGCGADNVRNYAETATVLAGLDEDSPGLFLASFNSPTDTGWVGDVVVHKLRINTAVHSPFVDPCETQFRRDLEAIFAEYPGPHIPKTTTMSTVTAEFKSDSYTPDYMWNNLRRPRFGESTVFIEVSPHPVLSQYIKSMGAHRSARHLKPGSSTFCEVHTLLEVLGSLLLRGVNGINFSELTGCPELNVEGPTYPFQRKEWRYGMDEPSYIQRPLNSTRLRISSVLPEPWMGQHVIEHTNLVPASAYLEMGLEFPDVTHLYDCQFPTRWDMAWTRTGPTFDVLHAYGKLGYGAVELGSDAITHVDVDALFKRILKASWNPKEILSYIRGHVDDVNRTDYAFHPALLDAIFQTGDKLPLGKKNGHLLVVCRTRSGAYSVTTASRAPLVLPDEFLCYSVLHEWSPEHWLISLYVLGEDHSVIFTVEGLRFELVHRGDAWPSEHYKMLWQPRDLPQVNHKGFIVLPDQTVPSDATEVLKALDQLAVQYTMQTLDILPHDFAPILPDRKLYFEWAKALSWKSHENISTVPAHVRDQYEALFELTRRVGTGQKDIMARSTAAVELLFSDGLMSKIYEHPPFVGSERDEHWKARYPNPGGRSGTGKLTVLLGQALLDGNIPEGFYIDYVSQEAAAKCPWPTVTAKALDLNVPVSEQHLDPCSFDIIVAFDVLHATPDIPATLVTIQDLLCSGGHIVILELDGDSFASAAIGTTWMNFIFGSFQEWFGVLGNRSRSTHCTLNAPQWKDALSNAGFSDTLFLTSVGGTVAHLAFISQSDGVPLSTRLLLSSETGKIPSSVSSSPSTPLLPYSDIASRLAYDSLVPLIHEKKTGLTGYYDKSEHLLTATGKQNVILRHFSSGGEVAFVDFIASLDSTHPYILWLHTDMEASNAALLGLARTLRHEYPAWKIYLAIFSCSWNAAEQDAYVRLQLLALPWVDSEVMIDEQGEMRVPRVVKASSSRMELRGSNPVEFRDTDVWLSIQYIGLSMVVPSWTEFVGRVTAVGTGVADRYIVGHRVFGATNSPQGSVIVCDRAKLAVVPDGMATALAAALIGRLVFLSLAVVEVVRGSSKQAKVLLHAGRCTHAAIATYAFLHASGFDVAVSVSDGKISPSAFGAHPLLVSSRYHSWTSYLRNWTPRGVDIVFNFDEDISVARQTLALLSPRGKFVQIGGELPCSLPSGHLYVSINHDTIATEDNCLDRTPEVFDPAVIAALSPSLDVYDLSQLAAVEARSSLPSTSNRTILVDLQATKPDLSVLKGGVLRGTPAFNPRASYVIIGGIGGLGVNIARCLVENGAKHVILTSRSGEMAFETQKLVREKKILEYVRSIAGVTIDLRAVDVLDGEKTRDLFSNLQHPVAGIFYLAVRLNDQLLEISKPKKIGQLERMFSPLSIRILTLPLVYDVKVKGVKVLLEVVNPRSLDFLVLTSSLGTVFGSPGQANYAAAQTRMEALVTSLPNTVAVTVPPITDGGIFVRSLPPGNGRNAALDKYKYLGMTGYRVAQHLQAYSSVYIPSTEWKEVIHLGIPDYHMSSLRHLLAKENLDSSSMRNEWTIRGALALVLALDQDEIMDNVPLSSYGLDSLTSVRLSGTLKTDFGINVTQLQLLGNAMTVIRLMALQEEQKLAASSLFGIAKGHEADLDQTIVRLNNVTDGRPLFVIHGAGGGVLVMLRTAEMISSPVYGVQDTPEAPIDGTLEQLSAFYLRKIRAKQPAGPYRLGGFSFGAYVAFVIAQMLQKMGETVELIIMIDGSPAIMDIIRDISTSGTLDNGEELTAMFEDHFEKVAQGTSSSKFVSQFGRAYVAHLLMGLRACVENLRREKAGKFEDASWPATRTVVIRADKGIGCQPVSEGLSPAFNVELQAPDVELYEVPGTHFGVLNPQSGLPQVLEKVLTS
ncbi:polyketide synthase [Melanogaster broomeanus]|nr:polyketide synthase [Melanogaster broomeanus]